MTPYRHLQPSLSGKGTIDMAVLGDNNKEGEFKVICVDQDKLLANQTKHLKQKVKEKNLRRARVSSLFN